MLIPSCVWKMGDPLLCFVAEEDLLEMGESLQRTGLFRSSRLVDGKASSNADELSKLKRTVEDDCIRHIDASRSDGRAYIGNFDVSGPFQRPDYFWEASAVGWIVLENSKDAVIGEYAHLPLAPECNDNGYMYRCCSVYKGDKRFVIGERIS